MQYIQSNTSTQTVYISSLRRSADVPITVRRRSAAVLPTCHRTVYNSFNKFLLGIEEASPLGKDWSTVDAEPMKHVSYKELHF